MTAPSDTFWLAPSGRIHSLERCSGCGVRTKRVRLTYDQAAAHDVCPCARTRYARLTEAAMRKA